MALLLGSTWLALHVLVAEHGCVLVTVALCGITPVEALLRRTVA